MNKTDSGSAEQFKQTIIASIQQMTFEFLLNQYETNVNALKGNFKREKDNLLNELKEFKQACKDESYPVKKIQNDEPPEYNYFVLISFSLSEELLNTHLC